MKRGKTISYEDGLLDRLKDPEYATGYLNAVLEGNDSSEFLIALRHVAQACGISEIARHSSLGRESMYRTLSGKTSPRLDTVNRLLNAAGLKIAIEPISVK